MQALFIALFAGVLAVSLGLRWLNLRYQARVGHVVPPELEGAVDPAKLEQIAAYTRERSRIGVLGALYQSAIFGVFLFSGLLGAYDRLVAASTSSFVLHGVLFFVGLVAAESLLGVPLALYTNFRVEARYGFNRMTPALFFGDWLKGTAISLVLVALASAGALALVRGAPETWWLWVWAGFVGLSLFLMYASPYLIEPLFFKMEPLAIEGFDAEIRGLAERAGVHVGRVMKVDASRRSSHSNAYFTGIGRTKRVVLFDTLLEHMTRPEILAVLAHELGHWKKHHVLSRMVASYAFALVAAYAAFVLSDAPGLAALVGLESASFPARVVILGALGSLFLFPLTPLFSYWSRRHEWQADRFAVELHGRPSDLAEALIKLARENLSNLHPHPLYAAFYYSHPPMAERIRALRRAATARAR